MGAAAMVGAGVPVAGASFRQLTRIKSRKTLTKNQELFTGVF
jgi:hypothetical protein